MKRDNINKKKMVYGSFSILIIIAVIAAAVIINTIFATVGDNLKIDITSNKIYTISDITEDVLDNVSRKVEIYCLFDELIFENYSGYPEIMGLLESYNEHPNVAVYYVDPDKDPGIITELDPENVKSLTTGEFVVKSGIRTKKLIQSQLYIYESDFLGNQSVTGTSAEYEFTGAIKYVTAETVPMVYFVSNHNEASYDTGLLYIKNYLENNGYGVDKLNILTTGEIPSDTEILLFASPQWDLAGDEIEIITDYLEAGGNAIIMFESTLQAIDYTNFMTILKDYNIQVENTMVYEGDSARYIRDYPNIFTAVIEDNDINAEIITYDAPVYISYARSLREIKNTKNGLNYYPLLRTTTEGYATLIEDSEQIIEGALEVAVAAEQLYEDYSTKVIVCGSTSFISDDFYTQFQAGGNFMFFASIINWMSDIDSGIEIPAKTYDTSVLNMTIGTQTILGIVTVIVIPLAILGFGLYVFLKRRHL